MHQGVFDQLKEEGLITEAQSLKVVAYHQQAPISVHWELTTLLSLGILILTSGLGVLVYKNIDSIGHLTIIGFTAAACVACFVWCLKHAQGFTKSKVLSHMVMYDYVLLLGCLLLLTLTSYLQFQYNFFGANWGLATFIPMVILFIAAYYFDHLGVLSLAITNLATWAGIAVAPLNIFNGLGENNSTIIFTGLALGALLMAASLTSVEKKLKDHFAFTYKNFGLNILFISILAGMFHFDSVYALWLIFLLPMSIYVVQQATKESSFYFILIAVLYAFTGISYVVIKLCMLIGDIGAFYLCFIYFIGSCIGLIYLLIHFNKMLKR